MVDLFSGCGGLSLGMEYAGFEPVFFSEVSANARSTYLRNRRPDALIQDPRFHVDDIRKITRVRGAIRSLRASLRSENIDPDDIDLLVGGPPCQGFSGIGFRRTFPRPKAEIESNHLYEDMAVMVEALRPKVFVFENVRGLLTSRWDPRSQSGEIWDSVFNRFASIRDYQVAASLVYSRDYGVPQNRPRVLLVGIRQQGGLLIENARESRLCAIQLGYLPKPLGGAPDPEEVLGDLVERRFVNGACLDAYPRDAAGAWQHWFRSKPPRSISASRNPRLTHHEFSTHGSAILRKFGEMKPFENVPTKYRTRKFAQRRLPARWGSEGPTVTITSMPDDFVHFGKPRTLSVREWARFQTFPDWYEFSGSRTTGGRRRAGDPDAGIPPKDIPQYTQVGNAVPVKLAYELGRHFKDLICSR
jgi:DNA (cytosine-5)-methyltransferase 1